MVFPTVVTWREFPAPEDPSLFHFRPESAPSNPWAPRDPPSQTIAASPRCARSSVRTAPRSSSGAADHYFPFRVSLVSADSPRAVSAHRDQTLSPDNLPLPDATLPPPSPRYPARKPSAPVLRFPARASTAKTQSHFVPEAPRPTAPNPAVRGAARHARPPPNLPLRLGTSLPRLDAARTAPPAHHPRLR